MKRRIFLSVFFIITVLTASSQYNLQGKWYFFSRNRVVEMTITPDSLINKQLNWDLTNLPRNPPPQVQLILKQVEANQNNYLYLKDPKKTEKAIALTTIRIIKPGKELIVALNGTDSSMTDSAFFSDYISKDLDKKYGLHFYSEAESNNLRKQKDVSTMTLADFSLFVDKFLRSRAEMDSLSKLRTSEVGLMYYSYAITRIIIGRLGYNPFISDQEFDVFIRRFQENPGAKEMFNKLNARPKTNQQQ